MGLTIHLDTNAVTAFFTGNEDAVFIVERTPTLSLSPVVIGELKAGFALGRRQRENLSRLRRLLSSPRVIVPVLDEQVTDNYARIYKQLRSEGKPVPTNDLWIAAFLTEPDDVLFSYDRHFDSIDGMELSGLQVPLGSSPSAVVTHFCEIRCRDTPAVVSWTG